MSDFWTEDAFLGGRLSLRQPKKGFRAGHDSVLLAAAVPARAGEQVLELGAGVGVASLCLAARVVCEVAGIEIDPEWAAAANENAARNGLAARVRIVEADVMAAPLRPSSFHHVFFNPPFHPASGPASPDAARDRAMRDTANAAAAWMPVALAAVRPGGTVTAILRADRQEASLAAAGPSAAVIFPLFARSGDLAKRVLIQLTKGIEAPMRTAYGLVLHQPDGRPTEAAEAILRRGGALLLA